MSVSHCKSFRLINLAVMFTLFMTGSTFAQKPMMAVDRDLPLSAEQAAEAIGLLPLYARIKQLETDLTFEGRDEIVVLQQQILLKVTSTSLQINATTGQIDAEIADTRELENYLSSRRNSRVNLLNLASLGIGGTVGTANSALGFTDHNLASSVTSLVASGTTLGLSIWELKENRGQAKVLQAHSNMLGEVFGRPTAMNDMYPPVIVKFMHVVPPEDQEGLSRQERLIRSWVK